MSNAEGIVIRITGDSGDGIQLIGVQLTVTAALAGRDVRTLPDFPAEIRAPAGTVAGVSGFQLAMAEEVIFTAGESIDILVALNPAALKVAINYLNIGGLLIINTDSFTEKDLQKVGLTKDAVADLDQQYQVLSIPIITETRLALSPLGLSHSQESKAKNFYVLGLVLWLFDLEISNCKQFIEEKFKNSPQLITANECALLAGYNYGLTLDLSRRQFIVGQINRPQGDYRQITGVEAVSLALATIAVKSKIPILVAGYPITPASAILQECVRLADYGVQLFQAEDEIAAICACIGAAFGGNLALTCTSGPGLDLKSESLGLAVMAELPLVLIDVQRAGASTGLPTKTGQSDLGQALYGRHGEAPIPVFAATSPADCFNIIIEAFITATKYMTPVIVLLDAYLANAAEPWQIPQLEDLEFPKIIFNRDSNAYQRDEVLSRSWNVPGTAGFIHQLGGLEKQKETGKVNYDPENHQQMINLRAQKIKNVARDYQKIILEGSTQANILLIGWGSTYGSLKAAVNRCDAEGLPIALLQIRHLNPTPNDLGEVLAKFKKIFVAELNSGILCQIIRATFLVDAKSICQYNGQPFSTNFLINTIKANMA